ERASVNFLRYYSTRSMAFIMKGLSCVADRSYHAQLDILAGRLAAMFGHESMNGWHWYEPYLTYGNSCIPEAMLCAYEVTGKPDYKVFAYKSFVFLLGQVMADDGIHVVTNRGSAHRGKPRNDCKGGEQPIDVAYTIIALDRFYRIGYDDRYREMLVTSFRSEERRVGEEYRFRMLTELVNGKMSVRVLE